MHNKTHYSPPGSAVSRRQAIRQITGAAAGLCIASPLGALSQEQGVLPLVVKTEPLFELSPFLHMQFMEPLGVTDGSVEAAWDHMHDCWRPDVVNATRELAPTMLRWGGIFADFYRWREGVGPRASRPAMHNLCWGGMESNQVGTTEFVDFARQTGAEPLICVNFESDGRKQFMEAKGSVRTADAREAAAWVSYCNSPANAERRAHGMDRPLGVKYWQIGNETSYDRNGFNLETAAKKTVEFANAMRQADPEIRLIAWGDSGWAARMAEIAGEHVQFLAFHHMFDPDNARQPVLRGELYRRDPEATWNQLMEAWKINDRKIREVRENRGKNGIPLAMTECHFAIPGRNRCDVLSTWAAGVSYARILNNHQRHGDALKIATSADFCGTRWQVNAVMIPVPGGKAYLMPVARVTRLFRHHIGDHAIGLTHVPDGLDVVASRRGNRLYVHVVNTNRTRSVRAQMAVAGTRIETGRVFQIEEEPMAEISSLNSADIMKIVEKPLPQNGIWEFPAASVSALELDFAKA